MIIIKPAKQLDREAQKRYNYQMKYLTTSLYKSMTIPVVKQVQIQKVKTIDNFNMVKNSNTENHFGVTVSSTYSIRDSCYHRNIGICLLIQSTSKPKPKKKIKTKSQK